MDKQSLLALYGEYRLLCDEYGWHPSRNGFNAYVKHYAERELWAR